MAEKKSAEKKSTEDPSKRKLLLLALSFISVGIGYSLYEWMRPLTPEEKKAQKEIEEQERRDREREAKERKAKGH
jgi:hypothetical protein